MGTAVFVFRDPLGGKGAILDFFQNLLHFLLGILGDNPLAGLVIAELSGIGNGITHHLESAGVDQVYNQLHLMDALEISIFRSIARFHQGFKAGLHQSGNTAAQYGLFAEQVGFGFNFKGGFHNGGSGGADACAVSQGDVKAVAGVILVHSDQSRRSLALHIFAADGVPRSLGSDHKHVDVFRGDDLAKVDIEAMSEGQSLTLGHVRGDIPFVHIGLAFVGNQDHNDVGGLNSLWNRHDG